MDRNNAKEVYKYYRRVCIPRFGHRAPNTEGKPVLNVDKLRVNRCFRTVSNTMVAYRASE